MNKRHDARKEFPFPKEGWNHSDRVLVYYEPIPELDLAGGWSIAYYHYDPPFKNEPEWVDFNIAGRVPIYWWDLPSIE